MKLVMQEHKNGCGVACAAMVVGISYAEAHAFFAEGREKSFDEPHSGMTHYDLFHFFNLRGFVYQHYYRIYGRTPVPIWPPPLFAQAHIFAVSCVAGSHYLCINEEGRIFCPYLGEIKSLEPMYFKVEHVIGIWPKPISQLRR